MNITHGIALLLLMVSTQVGAAGESLDEAATYRRIQELQRAPDAHQRAWLQELSRYQSTQQIALPEGRGRVLTPRFPIAIAAQAALHQLDVVQRLNELRSGHAPFVLPTKESSAVDIDAWKAWIRSTPNLSLLNTPTARAHDWPEVLLLAMVQHAEALRFALPPLLKKAQSGASLRWLDTHPANISNDVLVVAEANPALAEWAWAQWAKRANSGSIPADKHLRRITQTAPNTPGLAAGLALWHQTDAVLQPLLKSRATTHSSAYDRLRSLVESRRQFGPSAANAATTGPTQ